MSVLVVGGHRFAAGLDWEREVLRGGKAAKAARDRGHRWTVELGGQTGFLGDIENPGGLAPLAGALVEYVRKRPVSVLSVSDGGMVTLFDGFQASGRA